MTTNKVDAQLISAVCDTLLPSLEPPLKDANDEGVADFYLKGAITHGIDEIVNDAVTKLDAPMAKNVNLLLRFLEEAGFLTETQESREALLIKAGDDSLQMRGGLQLLRNLTMGTFINAEDEDGYNPIWPVIGYDPLVKISATPGETPKVLNVEKVATNDSEVVLEADVVIVGSGGGGSVIAARAAQAGLNVVVLEAGEQIFDAKRTQHGREGGARFLREGLLYSESGQMGILAGTAVGGGTQINSMVCLKPPMKIRKLWAEMGLDGLDGPDFDNHLDTVWKRLGVNSKDTYYNANTRAMITGLSSLGYTHERLTRNFVADENSYFCGFDPEGNKNQHGYRASTTVTYLDDAAAAGAKVYEKAWVEEVVTEGDSASGVKGQIYTTDGIKPLAVNAAHVVIAAGGIESPGILLRSGIGGPAVGKNLRLHPAWIVTGVYSEPIKAWKGQIQSAISFDLTETIDGEGFLVESLSMNVGSWAGLSPLTDARTARDRMRQFGNFATWHGVSHDHGAGEIYLDENRKAALKWDLDDEVDHKIAIKAHQELAKMHHAAGAQEMFTFHWNDLRWKKGQDFEQYLLELENIPARDHLSLSAHQMGSCRMGSDPKTSVANGNGALHDVKNVWIGDGSALPTAPGVNPMISLMALAERTAEQLINQINQ